MTDTDNGLADFFDTTPPQSDPLRDSLVAMIRSRDDATPRHQQVELGPSDVSHPCMRRLAYGLMVEPGCNPQFDPLPSIIGTAVHGWLDSAAKHANEVLRQEFQRKCEKITDPETRMFTLDSFRPRWLTETKVQVAPGLSGHCDLYDTDTDTVIDWKVVGTPRLRTYRKDPGPAYKTQVYLYGRGFENMGLPVKQVAIAFVPRGATLHSLHVWKADYDPKIADWALARRTQVIALLADFQVDTHPERYQWIPVTPYDCRFCPWYSTDPKGPLECKGDGS